MYFYDELLEFIIDDCLEVQINQNKTEENKTYWISVFDQLNRIFGRPKLLNTKDVGLLPKPFQWMKILAAKRNVHTVISASADNSLSYKRNLAGFVEFGHPLLMDEEEVKKWKASECQNMDVKEWNSMARSTGLYPLEISNYLD